MRRGFMLPDLAAIVVVAATAIAVLLASSSDQRRLGRLGDDVAHLKQIGQGGAEYATDNADKFWTFSWRAGVIYQTLYPDLNFSPDDLTAAANQAVYLIRTRGNRPTAPRISNWIPHLSYTHLVLVDYLDRPLPWRPMVSAADRERLKWASDPQCFMAGCFLPCQPSPSDPGSVRWPFGSSYLAPTCFYDLSPAGSRISQASTYNSYYFFPTSVLAGAPISSVSFPSQKVLFHDVSARHFGSRQPYCTHDQARLPLLMVDGSVPVRSAAEANRGWDPNNPNNLGAYTAINYSMTNCWEPAPLNPAGDIVQGRFRYTRRALQGRDFGGPEVP